MKLERTTVCPLCESDGEVLYSALQDRVYSAPGNWNIRRCLSCRSLWLDPRPTREDLHLCYEDYFTHQEEVETVAEAPETIQHRFKSHILPGRMSEHRELASLFLGELEPGSLLDVGCGNGSFLARMRECGWEVTGLETDPLAAELAAQRYDLDVITGYLEEVDLPESSFHAITLSHVIEHVHDPFGLIQRCRELLQPGGSLVIVTPNLNSLGHTVFGPSWFPLMPPRHLILFQPESLLGLLDKARLRVLRWRTAARTASGIFDNSVNIRETGRAKSTVRRPYYQKIIISGLRLGFVAAEYWMNLLFRDLGEETFVLATKDHE